MKINCEFSKYLECRRASVFHISLLEDYNFFEEDYVITSIADEATS
jgi:hypothetical protein